MDCPPCITTGDARSGYDAAFGTVGEPGDPGQAAFGAQPFYPSGATVRADGWCYIGDPGCGSYGPNYGPPGSIDTPSADMFGLAFRKEGDRLTFKGCAEYKHQVLVNQGPLSMQVLCLFPLPNDGSNDRYFGTKLGVEARYTLPNVTTQPDHPAFGAWVASLFWGDPGAQLTPAFISPTGIQLFYQPGPVAGMKVKLLASSVPLVPSLFSELAAP